MALSEQRLDAWRAVLNTHARVVGRVESALAAAGLPPLAWYDVLWALKRAPGGRLRLAELAEHLTVSRGGATKLVDRLAARELVTREVCETDARGRHAVLTDAGAELLRAMWLVYRGVLEESLSFGDAEGAAIAAALSSPSEERTTAASASASSAGG
jgi:DNA-binding MarR family transcriptional regulator